MTQLMRGHQVCTNSSPSTSIINTILRQTVFHIFGRQAPNLSIDRAEPPTPHSLFDNSAPTDAPEALATFARFL